MVLLVLGVFIAEAVADCPHGATISNPTMGSTYDRTSPIATNGGGYPIGKQMTVKLLKNGVIKTEATIQIDSNMQWSHDFAAPTGGWEAGNDWSCEVWCDGNKKIGVGPFTLQ